MWKIGMNFQVPILAWHVPSHLRHVCRESNGAYTFICPYLLSLHGCAWLCACQIIFLHWIITINFKNTQYSAYCITHVTSNKNIYEYDCSHTPSYELNIIPFEKNIFRGSEKSTWKRSIAVCCVFFYTLSPLLLIVFSTGASKLEANLPRKEC